MRLNAMPSSEPTSHRDKKTTEREYDMHISITGRLGSGKSTVAGILRDKYGFEIYSTGTVQRAMAAEMGLTTLEMNELMKNDVHFDHKIDDAVVRISEQRQNDRLIFDSRMAWHFAKHSFRVFVTIDPQIAGNRCAIDRHGDVENYTSAEDASAQLLERSRLENLRFKEIYGVDNLDYSNYDLIVDSSVADQYMVAELVYREYLAYCDDPAAYGKKMYLAAQSIYPAETPEDAAAEAADGAPVPVFTVGGYHFAAQQYGRVLAGIRSREPFLPCRTVPVPEDAAASLAAFGEAILEDYERLGSFSYVSRPAVYRKK